jgi:hypothetical protein
MANGIPLAYVRSGGGGGGATGPTGPTGPAGSGGSLPFTDEGNATPFTLDTTLHAYRSTNNEASVTVNLPPAITAGEQFYIVETHGSGIITVVPDGTDVINNQNVSVIFSQGLAILLYCNGVDGWTQLNYAQVSSVAGNTLLGLGSGLYVPTPAIPSQDPSVRSPILTGDNIIISAVPAIDTQIVTMAGTLATATLQVNDGLIIGQLVYITFQHAITSISYSGANFDASALAFPTAILAGQMIILQWSGALSKWVRIL